MKGLYRRVRLLLPSVVSPTGLILRTKTLPPFPLLPAAPVNSDSARDILQKLPLEASENLNLAEYVFVYMQGCFE